MSFQDFAAEAEENQKSERLYFEEVKEEEPGTKKGSLRVDSMKEITKLDPILFIQTLLLLSSSPSF